MERNRYREVMFESAITIKPNLEQEHKKTRKVKAEELPTTDLCSAFSI